MHSARIAPLVAVVMGLGVTCSSTIAAQAIKHYDGHWWRSASVDEQGGFIDGYIDCYVYEYKGPAGFADRSSTTLVRLIDGYYSKHASEMQEPVPRTLSRFRDGPGDTTTTAAAEGGEVYFEPHGYFNGDYWKGLSDSGRLGFVEGYLVCHADQSRNAGGVFKESPTVYRNLVTRWYGLNDDTGKMDASREHDKIADVLSRVRSGFAEPTGSRN